MSKPYKGYTPYQDRHGKWRHRVRIAGHLGFLDGGPKELGPRAFDKAYHTLRMQLEMGVAIVPKPAPAPSPLPGTVTLVLDQYLASDGFLKRCRAENTRTNVRNLLTSWSKDHGDLPVSLIVPEVIRAAMDNRKDTPKGANNWLSAMKGFCDYGVEQKLLIANPCAGIKPYKFDEEDEEGFHGWSEDEWSQFMAYWPEGSKPWLAAMLLMYTGQRASDVCRLGWNVPRWDGDNQPMVHNGRLQFKQKKTRRKMNHDWNGPMGLKLQHALQVCNILPHVPAQPWFCLKPFLRYSPDDVITHTGEGEVPISAARFSEMFSKWCTQAGLPQCTAHGIRKLAAQRVYSATASLAVTKAFTGHKTERALLIYLKGLDEANLADKIAM